MMQKTSNCQDVLVSAPISMQVPHPVMISERKLTVVLDALCKG